MLTEGHLTLSAKYLAKFVKLLYARKKSNLKGESQ